METFIFYIIFVGVTFWIALEPGPGFVQLATNCIKHSRQTAILSALGMFVGAFPFILSVGLGVGQVLKSVPDILFILKLVAATYLFWLACTMFRKDSNYEESAAVSESTKTDTFEFQYSEKFREGFLLVLLNPRTPLFYAAFLPLFLNTKIAVSAELQLLMLGGAVATIFLITDLVFVFFISRSRDCLMANNSLQTIAKYIAAGSLSLFSLKLLLEED